MIFIFALSWLLLLAWPVSGASTVKYCSTVNTGADSSPENDTFQSVGLCTQTCTEDYAFGILQGSSCWCSNTAPNKATNVDQSKCNDSCPGYPDDNCGNESDGLFGYIVLMNHKASSTATVSSSTSTGTSTGTSSDTGSTTTAAGSTVNVETVEGQVQTLTVGATTATAAADTASTSSQSSSSGLSTGAVAGVAVGSVAGFGAILALLLVVICARRRQRHHNSLDPSINNTLIDGRQSKGSQMSFMKGMFSDNHSHTLSAGSSSHTPQRVPTFTDKRMKPDASIYPNGNRDSSVSLQDNEDYSRPVLRATNPD